MSCRTDPAAKLLREHHSQMLARPERALTQDEAWRRAEPHRLFVVAWLQTGWMVATQIDPFCASSTDRTEGIVPVQNGGYARDYHELFA